MKIHSKLKMLKEDPILIRLLDSLLSLTAHEEKYKDVVVTEEDSGMIFSKRPSRDFNTEVNKLENTIYYYCNQDIAKLEHSKEEECLGEVIKKHINTLLKEQFMKGEQPTINIMKTEQVEELISLFIAKGIEKNVL